MDRSGQARHIHPFAGAHVKRWTYNMQILSSCYTSRDIHAYTTKHRDVWEHRGHTFRYWIPCVRQHLAFTPVQRGSPMCVKRSSHVQTYNISLTH